MNPTRNDVTCCRHCRQPLTGRNDKSYCSAICKQRAYRRRKRHRSERLPIRVKVQGDKRQSLDEKRTRKETT